MMMMIIKSALGGLKQLTFVSSNKIRILFCFIIGKVPSVWKNAN